MAEKPETVEGMSDAVERRRLELGLSPNDFAEASGLTTQGLAPVRNGVRKSYSDKTRTGVARALRWPVDWYDQLANGTPADDLPTVDHPEDADPMEKGMAQLLEEFKRGNARLEARIEQLERAVREQGTAPHSQ